MFSEPSDGMLPYEKNGGSKNNIKQQLEIAVHFSNSC